MHSSVGEVSQQAGGRIPAELGDSATLLDLVGPVGEQRRDVDELAVGADDGLVGAVDALDVGAAVRAGLGEAALERQRPGAGVAPEDRHETPLHAALRNAVSGYVDALAVRAHGHV